MYSNSLEKWSWNRFSSYSTGFRQEVAMKRKSYQLFFLKVCHTIEQFTEACDEKDAFCLHEEEST